VTRGFPPATSRTRKGSVKRLGFARLRRQPALPDLARRAIHQGNWLQAWVKITSYHPPRSAPSLRALVVLPLPSLLGREAPTPLSNHLGFSVSCEWTPCHLELERSGSASHPRGPKRPPKGSGLHWLILLESVRGRCARSLGASRAPYGELKTRRRLHFRQSLPRMAANRARILQDAWVRRGNTPKMICFSVKRLCFMVSSPLRPYIDTSASFTTE